MLIQSRDKYVEKLEKRLKWMEDQLKRVVEGQPVETDAESRNEFRGVETPSSGPSQGRTSYSTQNIHGYDPSDLAFTTAEASPQAPALGVPSQKSNSKSATLYFPS